MTRAPRHAGREPEPGVRRRDRSLLVSINSYTISGAEPVVEMASLNDLMEVAKKYETVVMEHVTSDQAAYLVWDDGLLYRYTAPRSVVPKG